MVQANGLACTGLADVEHPINFHRLIPLRHHCHRADFCIQKDMVRGDLDTSSESSKKALVRYAFRYGTRAEVAFVASCWHCAWLRQISLLESALVLAIGERYRLGSFAPLSFICVSFRLTQQQAGQIR